MTEQPERHPNTAWIVIGCVSMVVGVLLVALTLTNFGTFDEPNGRWIMRIGGLIFIGNGAYFVQLGRGKVGHQR